MSYERGWKRAGLAIEAALLGGGGTSGAGEATPSPQSQSVAGIFALTPERGMHMNITCGSDFSGIDFEVPINAAPAMAWLIEPKHTNCYVSVVGNNGSIEPAADNDTAYLVKGGVAIVEIVSQSISFDAPVVQVRGSVFTPATPVALAKTYSDDDSGQDFLVTAAVAQAFTAVGNYKEGFYCNIFNGIGSTIAVDGPSGGAASYTIPVLGAVTIKKLGSMLLAIGSGGSALIT